MIFLQDLEGKKNLLGFSGGPDSTALFFCLLEEGIDFDMGIVDYGLREQSIKEVAYAKELAMRYQKRLFIHQALGIVRDFEHQARVQRYGFFERIIKEEGYENLLLAHHLNDRLEWFIMQLCKGSGLNNLLGFRRREEREGYVIVRPLLEISKDQILEMVRKRVYFEDSSNENTRIWRNKIRKNYANSLIQEHAKGITKTLGYLQEEQERLYLRQISQVSEIFYFKKSNDLSNLDCIDKILKKMGYVLSAPQRQEILKQNYDGIIAGKYLLSSNEGWIFLTSGNVSKSMDRSFREWARSMRIPKRLRPKIAWLLEQGKLKKEQMNFLQKRIF